MIEVRFVQECFDRKGVRATYVQDPHVEKYVQETESGDMRLSRFWGFFDPDNAATRGYHFDPARVPGISTDYLGKVSDEIGTECTTEAVSRMPNGQHWGSLMSLGILPGGGPETPMDHPTITEAIDDWRNCMEGKGFKYPDPVTAAMSFPTDGPVTPQEIQVANTDVECKRANNVVGRILSVVTAYDQDYIDKHRSQLEENRAKFDAFLRENTR